MLSIYMGKPGSGKSYYAVLKISQLVLEYVGFEIRNGVEHKRKIYTNLNVNLHALDEFVSDRVGKTVNAQKYVQIIGDEFFYDVSNAGNPKKKCWWEDFPDGAFIIIDEVQYYLGSEREGGDAEYLKSFRNYISTHRHKKHDLIFITQHTDNVQRGIMSMAEDAYHIINIKSKVIPFLGISFSDFDVIKEAFGFKQQYIQILYGNYIGRSFKREAVFHELLRPDIYALYKSHTLSDGEASDRPSLHFSPLGAIWWFIKKHFWHLFFKGILIYLIFDVLFNTVLQLPSILSDAFTKRTLETIKDDNKKAVVPVSSPVKDSSSDRVLAPIATRRPPMQVKNDVVTADPLPIKHTKIYVFGPDFVVTDEGRKIAGEVIYVNGTKKVISGFDLSCNRVITSDWMPTRRDSEPVIVSARNENVGGSPSECPED